MSRQSAWVVLATLIGVSALSARDLWGEQARPREHDQRQTREARPQDPNRGKWWINPENRKELGITDEQSAQIDAIFESMMPAQRATWREREKLEGEVSKLLKEHIADVASVTQQVEKVEKLEAELRARRTVMLYRMNLVLTPDQRVKLEAFLKRRDENRRKSDRR